MIIRSRCPVRVCVCEHGNCVRVTLAVNSGKREPGKSERSTGQVASGMTLDGPVMNHFLVHHRDCGCRPPHWDQNNLINSNEQESASEPATARALSSIHFHEYAIGQLFDVAREWMDGSMDNRTE